MLKAIVLFLFLPQISLAQITFQRTYGGTDFDLGFSMEQTNEGGYVLLGSTSSFGNGSSDIYLIKTDAEGTEQWSRTFGGELFDSAYNVRQTADGGYVLCGFVNGLPDDSLVLIKTNASGNEEWQNEYPIVQGGSVGYHVEQVADGGFILCGYSGYGFSEDMQFIRTTAAGAQIWSTVYDLGGRDFAYSIKQLADGGFMALGSTDAVGAGDKDVLLMKLDVNGDSLWTRTYGTSAFEQGYNMWLNTDGGFTLCGKQGYPVGDAWLVRTDADGDTLWTKAYTELDEALDVQQTADGGFAVAGSALTQGTNGRVMDLLRTAPDGTELWQHQFPYEYSSNASAIDVTSDGGYALLGTATSVNGMNASSDLLLVKTDGSGTLSVEENGMPSEAIALYPVPANDVVHVALRTMTNDLNATVYDATGRKMMDIRSTSAQGMTFDCSAFDNGIYTLTFWNEGTRLGSRVFIVSH